MNHYFTIQNPIERTIRHITTQEKPKGLLSIQRCFKSSATRTDVLLEYLCVLPSLNHKPNFTPIPMSIGSLLLREMQSSVVMRVGEGWRRGSGPRVIMWDGLTVCVVGRGEGVPQDWQKIPNIGTFVTKFELENSTCARQRSGLRHGRE